MTAITFSSKCHSRSSDFNILNILTIYFYFFWFSIPFKTCESPEQYVISQYTKSTEAVQVLQGIGSLLRYALLPLMQFCHVISICNLEPSAQACFSTSPAPGKQGFSPYPSVPWVSLVTWVSHTWGRWTHRASYGKDCALTLHSQCGSGTEPQLD